MANRPKGYGMSAEVQRKIASKYDEEEELEARRWIEDVLEEELDPSVGPDDVLGYQQFQKLLKDGIVLCRLAQKIMGADKCKYRSSKMPFHQMENIGNFLTACENYGCAKHDLCQTVDLYECQNMVAVINTIRALARKAQAKGFAGPLWGPKEATKNVRDFDDDTLNAGQTMIGLQMGTNKVASQKGMIMGKPRGIMGVDK